jgi:23S rRNA-/tRNA-specific pseudouridylate synthase
MNERRRLQHGLAILYEDREILVVDKPSGLLTTARGCEREKTAYWILCDYLRKRGEKRRVAVVHRLDRDTSGVLVFAKSERTRRY